MKSVQKEYEVERIVAKRKIGKEVPLVSNSKWYGYNRVNTLSWEPASSFARCKHVIAEFEHAEQLKKTLRPTIKRAIEQEEVRRPAVDADEAEDSSDESSDDEDLLERIRSHGFDDPEGFRRLEEKTARHREHRLARAAEQEPPPDPKGEQPGERKRRFAQRPRTMVVIQQVNPDGELAGIFQAADYRLVSVVHCLDCSGVDPCRAIAPAFQQLANYYSNVVFVKVNVDYCRATCQEHQINAMPTFVFFVRGQEVERVQGANPDRLRQVIDLHFQEAPRVNPNRATREERDFLHNQIVKRVDFVKQYEDEVSKMLALSVIPLEAINRKATIDGKLHEFLQAKHLMEWFHDDFFRWVDHPKCAGCGHADTKHVDNTEPTSEERERGGGRVEVFECAACSAKTPLRAFRQSGHADRNPRGSLRRVGELLHALLPGGRPRGALASAKEWIHCDPCENVIDRPLLYEKGWKKELKYVFGIAHDHVQDCTWRYTADHKATLKRRKAVRENVLVNCIVKLNKRLEGALSEDAKKELLSRRLRELIRFLSPQLNERQTGDEQGRTSGGLDWRLHRAETQATAEHTPMDIQLTDAEKEAKRFVLEYDVVKDTYTRPNGVLKEIKGFTTLLHQAANCNRKVEKDHQQAYICRARDANSADISWKIVFGGLKAKRAIIDVGEIVLFSSGKAAATVCGGDLCTMLEKDGRAELTELDSAEYLEIAVNLRGGDGPAAWQHAQLFRTSTEQPKANLRFEIEFE
ncbi:Peptide-N(4)-(N-acetyl-beta-glucosaminyl)asparagine amidase [Aphelenchoides fujianensis]|nr:Peptide-N(4)-(N-acetyl-beta-glucosaminyl)asparagine amidase [Aphelenchoides fujianensis]